MTKAVYDKDNDGVVDNAQRLGGHLPEHYASVERVKKEKLAVMVGESATADGLLTTQALKNGIEKLTVVGKSTQDGTPAPDSPAPIVSVGDGGSTEVAVCGENLAFVNIKGYPYNDRYNIDGNSESFVFICKKGETYIWNCEAETDRASFAIFESIPVKDSFSINGTIYSCPKNTPFTVNADGYCNVYVNSTKDETIKETFMLNKGTTALPFEPYKGNNYTLPITLNGIPVESGGNWTDESGQQWIADTAEFKNGVVTVTRRTKEIKLNGTEPFSLSTRGVFYLNASDAFTIDETNTETFKGCISDRYNAGTWLDASNSIVCCTLGWGNAIAVYDNSFADVTAFKEYLATNPLTVVYALGTPTTETYTIDQLTNAGGVVNIIQPDGAGLKVEMCGGASEAELERVGQEVQAAANNAQTTADSALTAANNAQTTADAAMPKASFVFDAQTGTLDIYL